MKNNKKWTEGLVWLCILLAVSLTACGAAPDVAEGPLPEAELNAAEGSEDIGKVQNALSLLRKLRLRPVADITPKEWAEKPLGTPHWQILNNAWFTGGDDVSCAISGRSVNTNAMFQLDDKTKLDASFIKNGAALTAGGTFWVCARQYTFVDSVQNGYGVATLRAVLRQRNSQGTEVRSGVLGVAQMQSAGPDNNSNSAPRWYAFSVPSGWTFSAGDTLEGGLRSADNRSRVQVYKYLVDVNVSIPVSVNLP